MGTLWVGKEREKKVRQRRTGDYCMNQRAVNDQQENKKYTCDNVP